MIQKIIENAQNEHNVSQNDDVENTVPVLLPQIIPPERKLRPPKKNKKSPKNSNKLIKRTPKKKSLRIFKHNWDLIRSEFIEGIVKDPENKPDEREYVTLKAIAERHKVNYDMVRDRSATESWFESRQAWQMTLAKQRQLKRINLLSNQSVEFDTSTFNMAKVGVNIVMTRMAEILNEISAHKVVKENALEALKQGKLINPADLETIIDSKELVTLASAAQIWQQVGNKALGTDVIKHELQIDASIDMEVRAISLTAELGRDDPERLAAFLFAAQKAGLFTEEIEQESHQPTKEQLAIEDALLVDTEAGSSLVNKAVHGDILGLSNNEED